jgi:hypothetical protein
MSHRIQISWVGGDHEFALGIGQLRAIQQACDAGPQAITARLVNGDWRFDDLYEVLRQGLIGSGHFNSSAATELIARLFEQHPLLKFKPAALAVLAAALVGEEADDAPGEPDGAGAPGTNGISGDSTVPVR